MKNHDTENSFKIKTISPSSSSKGIRILFISQKIKHYTIFTFFNLTFYKFFYEFYI